MRAELYSALIAVGLICAGAAKAGQAELTPSGSSTVELVIDTRLHPAELRFASQKVSDTLWDHADVGAFGADKLSGLNLALSSPGILFGRPHNFLTLSVRFGSVDTTAVVYQNASN